MLSSEGRLLLGLHRLDSPSGMAIQPLLYQLVGAQADYESVYSCRSGANLIDLAQRRQEGG